MSGKRYLVITPKDIGLTVINPDRDVAIHLDLDDEQAGLLGIDVMIRVSPTEARQIARALTRKADEAEAGLPRA
jgi:ethanolamine utilization microcompartment shell protein EutS